LSYERARDYIVLKFYIPDYGMQSPPITIPASEVYEKGLPWAIQRARDRFLRDFLRHEGQGETIHPSHWKLLKDGKITYSAKLRELTLSQLSALRGLNMPRHHTEKRKVGWERRFGTAKERRERFLRKLM